MNVVHELASRMSTNISLRLWSWRLATATHQGCCTLDVFWSRWYWRQKRTVMKFWMGCMICMLSICCRLRWPINLYLSFKFRLITETTFLPQEVGMHELKCFEHFYSELWCIAREILKFIGHTQNRKAPLNWLQSATKASLTIFLPKQERI